jgi:hypothetical protein
MNKEPWYKNNWLSKLNESEDPLAPIFSALLSQDLSKYKSMSKDDVLERLGLKKSIKLTGCYGDVDYTSPHMLNDCDLSWARFLIAVADFKKGWIQYRKKPVSGFFKGAYKDTSFEYEGFLKEYYLQVEPRLRIYWFDCSPYNNFCVDCGAYMTGSHSPETKTYFELMKRLAIFIRENFE